MAKRASILINTCSSEIGAGKYGTAKGVLQLLEKIHQIQHPNIKFAHSPIENNHHSNLYSDSYAKNIEAIYNNIQKTYFVVKESLKQSESLVVNLTGDHSNSMATVSALSDTYGTENIGVIWIDAHADMHSPYTTPSGNLHGMPLAAMLNIDNISAQKNEIDIQTKLFWDRLKDPGNNGIFPKIKPENVVIICLRDTEEEEDNLILEHGIKTIKNYKVKDKNMQEVCEKVFTALSHCSAIHCSFDVDSIDEKYISGTGTPVEDGFSIEEATELLRCISLKSQVKSMDFTEINPSLENGNLFTPATEIAFSIFETIRKEVL
jgi:arginase